MPSLLQKAVKFLGLGPTKKRKTKAKKSVKKAPVHHTHGHTVGRPRKVGRPRVKK